MIAKKQIMRGKWCPFVQYVESTNEYTQGMFSPNRPDGFQGSECITNHCAMYVDLPGGHGCCGLVLGAHRVALRMYRSNSKKLCDCDK